jgi:hypothetical protein
MINYRELRMTNSAISLPSFIVLDRWNNRIKMYLTTAGYYEISNYIILPDGSEKSVKYIIYANIPTDSVSTCNTNVIDYGTLTAS